MRGKRHNDNNENNGERLIKQAETICATKHLRFTPIRRRILDLIANSDRPPKAYELLERIAAKQPPIVYRALDFLLQAGFIHRVSGLNAYTACAHPTQCASCHLLVCVDCGRVEECCAPPIQSAVARAARDNQFKFESAVVEINGHCKSCAHKKEQTNERHT